MTFYSQCNEYKILYEKYFKNYIINELFNLLHNYNIFFLYFF